MNQRTRRHFPLDHQSPQDRNQCRIHLTGYLLRQLVLLSCLFAIIGVERVDAFTCTISRNVYKRVSRRRDSERRNVFSGSRYSSQYVIKEEPGRSCSTSFVKTALGAKEKDKTDGDNDEEENDVDVNLGELGMKSAFDQLERIESLDLEDSSEDEAARGSVAKQLDRIAEFESLDDDETEEELSAEELNLYRDMFNEISGGEDSVYGNVLENLTSEDGNIAEVVPRAAPESPTLSVDLSLSKGKGGNMLVEEIYEDADGLGSGRTTDKENFVDEVVTEALKKVEKVELPEGLDPVAVVEAIGTQQSIREDKELMDQINAVFDKAKAQLEESIEEIRETSEKETRARLKEREARIQEDQERLAAAEDSVKTLIGNMSKESEQVAKAMKDLEAVRQTAEEDKLVQLADFRKLNIIQQGAVAGSVLFFARALTELFQAVGDSTHLGAAVLQFGIAGLCAFLFFLL